MNDMPNNQQAPDELNMIGKWTNIRTNEEIFVRSNVIDGDNMIIMTDKGPIDINTFSNNYIRVSDEVYNNEGQVISKSKFNEPLNYMLSPDPVKTVMPEQQQPVVETSASNVQQKNDIDVNNYLLDKIFTKYEFKPDFKLIVTSGEHDAELFNAIKIIKQIYDISDDAIVQYIMKNIIDESLIKSPVNDYIKQQLK